MTTPNVPLSGGGVVLPTTQMNIPLTGLVPAATYYVSCSITTSSPFMIVKFGNILSGSASSITSYALNGNTVTQGQLDIGLNTAIIIGNFAAPSTESVTFTNLDQDDSFTVSNCYASPVVGLADND